jgi:hypothetical protein
MIALSTQGFSAIHGVSRVAAAAAPRFINQTSPLLLGNQKEFFSGGNGAAGLKKKKGAINL